LSDFAELVGFIVRNIVDHPDAVVVETHGRARSQTVGIRLDQRDVGRVIGKGGRNIEAIRAVVKAAGVRDRSRVNVEIVTEAVDGSAAPDGDNGGPRLAQVEAETATDYTSRDAAPEA
jgi:predicted RNA-binding protein YlqC (UPF0109 family)